MHVAEHGLPRQQLVELLEHHHAVGAGPLDRLAVEPDLPLDRLHEARDRLEQRRLAAAGGPEHHEALALVDLEADAPGRGDQMLLGLVLQRHVVDREQRRACLPGRSISGAMRPPVCARIMAAMLSPCLAGGVSFDQEKRSARRNTRGRNCMLRRLTVHRCIRRVARLARRRARRGKRRARRQAIRRRLHAIHGDAGSEADREARQGGGPRHHHRMGDRSAPPT